MAERANLRPVEQLGMDEQRVDDETIIAALEERQQRKEHKAEVDKAYAEAHEVAIAKIAELELPEAAARVGRFRVTREAVKARTVSFETKATSRIRIGLADEDSLTPEPAPRQEPVANFRRDPE